MPFRSSQISATEQLQAAARGNATLIGVLPLAAYSSERKIRADFWEGDATKPCSVKEKGFSVKRGEAIQ